VNTIMNLWVPQNAVNFLTNWTTINFSTRTLLSGFGLSSSREEGVKFLFCRTRSVGPS
jgi:hypothetical protein